MLLPLLQNNLLSEEAPPAPAGGGGGSSGPGVSGFPRRFRRPVLSGISLRQQPFKDEELEKEIQQEVEEAIEAAEQLEAAAPELGKISGHAVATTARRKALGRHRIVRQLRKTEKLSERVAKIQLERRINELVRQRREFFINENEDIEAILLILGEIL